jgi:hypothetical protein
MRRRTRGTLECCSIRSASGSEWVVIQSWVFFEARTIKCANASRMSGCRLVSGSLSANSDGGRGLSSAAQRHKKPQLPVREFPRLQGTEQSRNLQSHAEERIRGFNKESCPAKSLRNRLAKGITIANFQNRFQRSREVRTIVIKNWC